MVHSTNAYSGSGDDVWRGVAIAQTDKSNLPDLVGYCSKGVSKNNYVCV